MIYYLRGYYGGFYIAIALPVVEFFRKRVHKIHLKINNDSTKYDLFDDLFRDRFWTRF